MDIEERSRFVLTAAKALFVNGEATEQTVAAAARLADVLGLRAKLSVRWDELALQVDSANGALLRLEAAEPTGVEMDRVASVMRVIDELAAGDLKPEEARAEIETASHARPAPTWLFAIAAAAGATALSVIFGVDNFPAAAVIAGSAGMGALLRRVLARVSENVFLQPFCAALLAGVVGAMAVRSQLSSSLRLVAVCPCMILLPGPHILNSGLDLIRSRIHLGASRILFALLVVLAIAIGLLGGLALLGVNLPLEPAERRVPLWPERTRRAADSGCMRKFVQEPYDHKDVGAPNDLSAVLRYAQMLSAGDQLARMLLQQGGTRTVFRVW
jgi:uncharacterized membrane protein YjjP (DUF1212 family)